MTFTIPDLTLEKCAYCGETLSLVIMHTRRTQYEIDGNGHLSAVLIDDADGIEDIIVYCKYVIECLWCKRVQEQLELYWKDDETVEIREKEVPK